MGDRSEADADALRSIGLCVTTSAQGAASKWNAAFVEYFRGATRVVVIADCDLARRQAARNRAALIATLVGDVRVIDCAPQRNDGYDVSDYLAEGHTLEDLAGLADTTSQV